MKKRVKEAIAAELKYIDEMEFGDSDTTARIMHKLGFEDLSFEDLFDVEYGVYEEVEKSRDYVMDKSSHDGKVEGLPFNLDFVKMERDDNFFNVDDPEYLSKDEFTAEIIKDIRFMSFAEGGAMGCPGEVIFLRDDGSCYSVNFCYGDISIDDIIKVFPVLKDCNWGMFGQGSRVPEGWTYVSLGAGNHLIVRDDIYPAFNEALGAGLSEPEIYQRWRLVAYKLP